MGHPFILLVHIVVQALVELFHVTHLVIILSYVFTLTTISPKVTVIMLIVRIGLLVEASPESAASTPSPSPIKTAPIEISPTSGHHL